VGRKSRSYDCGFESVWFSAYTGYAWLTFASLRAARISVTS